jgi:hypothetical protein
MDAPFLDFDSNSALRAGAASVLNKRNTMPRNPALTAQLVNKLFSDPAEEIEIALLSVIGVSVFKRTPTAFIENQGHFGEYLIADIYTMRIVLCCSQNQLRRLDYAGVQVHGARQLERQSYRQLSLESVGSVLCFRQLARVNQPLYTDELSQDVLAGLIFVIIGLVKRPDITFEIDIAELAFYGLHRRVQASVVGGEDSYYQLDLLGGFQFPHLRCRLKWL